MPTDTVTAALEAIAALYDAEGRDAARDTAAALRKGSAADLPPLPPCALDADIRACLAGSPDPVAKAVLAAQEVVPWGVNPVASRMSKAADAAAAISTLLDPEGPIFNPDFRLGLLYMRPNSYYSLHNHDADETYAIIAGRVFWTAGEDQRWREPRSLVHHPSLMPHAFRTEDQGFVALWRWSGDINTHSYTFLPDPAAHG